MKLSITLAESDTPGNSITSVVLTDWQGVDKYYSIDHSEFPQDWKDGNNKVVTDRYMVDKLNNAVVAAADLNFG